MGYCNGFGGLFWGVRRDNLVSLTQKIKQSNHNVQSEKRRIYIKSQEERTVKTIKLSEGQENANDQFIKADFISTLPRLNFLACLSPVSLPDQISFTDTA